MSNLTVGQKVMMPRPRKRYGYSQLFGYSNFGYTRFGEFNPYAGQFQYWNSWGQRYHLRTRFYWPTVSYTPAIVASRNLFADGMSAWSALTSDEKASYHKRARPMHMGGHNLFLREYMSSH